MTGYLVSLLMGLAVGVAYGLVQVRSPAPPMIALIGLFGMVLGEQAVDLETPFRATCSDFPTARGGRRSRFAAARAHGTKLGTVQNSRAPLSAGGS